MPVDRKANRPRSYPEMGWSRKVRVCLAAANFYPVYAGPAIRFSRYLPGLLSEGLDVRVFSGTPEAVKAAASEMGNANGGRRLGRIALAEPVNGAPVLQVNLPGAGKKRRSFLFLWRLADSCRNSTGRPDVVQLLSCDVAGIPALIRLRRAGIPIVFTATMLPDPPRSSLVQLRRRVWLGLPFRYVDRIIVSSEVMREHFKNLGTPAGVEVIPNGVDIERFRPPVTEEERQKVRRALGIGREEPVVLFVGPIVPRKGVDLLVEAWLRLRSTHPRPHLVLAGPRLDATHPANREFHRRLNTLMASAAPDRIHVPGMVRDVEDYMRAADLFVFPSRREGMPNVIPEAMASGLPVLMTRFIGLPTEFGEPGRHYLLVRRDHEALAAAIGRLLGDPGRRRALGREARMWVERHLSVSRSIRQYAALYKRLASTRTGK